MFIRSVTFEHYCSVYLARFRFKAKFESNCSGVAIIDIEMSFYLLSPTSGTDHTFDFDSPEKPSPIGRGRGSGYSRSQGGVYSRGRGGGVWSGHPGNPAGPSSSIRSPQEIYSLGKDCCG